MSWDRSAITDIGVAMLNESLAGRTLTITSAAGGAGTTENLKTAADLADRRQTFALIGIEEIPPDPAQ
ncbi:MAG: hypothetical protein IJF59_05220, partial [Clostridia bacterium]|nr:hypothetical protein [Clostridia bacterium]